MSQSWSEPIDIPWFKAREKCSPRSPLLGLFNHLFSLEKEIDDFLTKRGCSPIGDLPRKLRYLRDKEYYLFRYRPRVLGGGNLNTYVRRVIKAAKNTRNDVCHTDPILDTPDERDKAQQRIIELQHLLACDIRHFPTHRVSKSSSRSFKN